MRESELTPGLWTAVLARPGAHAQIRCAMRGEGEVCTKMANPTRGSWRRPGGAGKPADIWEESRI